MGWVPWGPRNASLPRCSGGRYPGLSLAHCYVHLCSSDVEGSLWSRVELHLVTLSTRVL